MYKRAVVLTALCLFAVGFVAAEDGVTETEIKLGQSCALDGPAKALGTGMKLGLEVYFEKHNKTAKRKIKLVSKDDGYEPNRAIKNTRDLIEKDKVFALIGEVGTPTSKAVVPIAEETKVPFIGPFTGAGFLRDTSKLKQVVNVRSSYDAEMERHAQNLIDKKGLKKIACFYQNDGYGQAGLSGIKKALKKRNLELVATGTYERNTVDVKNGLLDIRKAKPEAVVMVGAYKPCAAFIKLAKKVGLKEAIFCNISFVGTEALRTELAEAGEGCVITQVVNFPWDDSVGLVKEYQEAMKAAGKESNIGFVSLEGYMVGKLFCMALKEVKGDLTRENLLKAFQATGTFDLGGVKLTYGASDNQGMDQVFLTVIQGGKIKPLQ